MKDANLGLEEFATLVEVYTEHFLADKKLFKT